MANSSDAPPESEASLGASAFNEHASTYSSTLQSSFPELDVEVRDSAKPIAPHLQIAEEDDDETITEKLKLQGVRLGKGMISPRVFWPALVVILAVAVIGIALPDSTNDVLVDMQSWIVTDFGWYYMLAIGFFIAFAAFVGFSKYGAIRLGRDGEDPEFGLLSWFAMLFAAGMGIGLVFYGVGEPLTYATSDPKPGWDGSETEKAQLAMAQTFLHWGLHPWAVYAVISLRSRTRSTAVAAPSRSAGP